MDSGRYEEALEVFSKFKETFLDSYEHYKTFEKESVCRRKLGKCNIGDIGPAGGYIFYDCDADNDVEYFSNDEVKTNKDGLISSECGWRYLEAAPEDLSGQYCFGYYRKSSFDENLSVGTYVAIGTGKANTEALVTAMGEAAYTESSGSEKGMYAAKACADYSIEVDGVVYDDWFLPSKKELDLMFTNLCEKGLGSFVKNLYFYCYWSSSEYGVDCAYECGVYHTVRGDSYRVRPVRAFNLTSQEDSGK